MKHKNKQKAFTLVEMLISIALFMIFLTTLFGAYSNLIGSQKDSSAVRMMYSGARDLFARLAEDVRLSTVDYVYYNSVADKKHILPLLSKDGLKQTVYKLVEDAESKHISKTLHVRNNLRCPFTEIEHTENIASENLEIADFSFLVSPLEDPYSIKSINKSETQLQPLVTFVAEFESADKFTFPLQASVSSRVYSKLDERDRISFEEGAAPVSCEF